MNQTLCSHERAEWTYLVFVDIVALPFLVELLIEAFFFDQVANVDVFQGNWRFLCEELCVCGFARAWCAGDDDDWGLPGGRHVFLLGRGPPAIVEDE